MGTNENKPFISLLTISATTLFIANFFDLPSITIMGSADFLLIFAAVHAANFK